MKEGTKTTGSALRPEPPDKGLPGRVLAWIWRESGHNQGAMWKTWRPIRVLCRVLCIIGRESKRDKITLRASALTFTVVLSLVPMLALGTAVLKGLGKGDQMRQAAYHIMDQLSGEEEVGSESSVTPEAPPSADISAAPASSETVTGPSAGKNSPQNNLTAHIRRAIDQIFDYVDNTDFAALGTFGILGLVLATLSVLGSIEQSMNAIWEVDIGRPMGRKVIDYMALMILLPVTVNLALATEATLQSPALLTRLHDLLPMVKLGHLLLKLLPLSALVLTFTLLYRFLPNTAVTLRAALAGGLMGGICWLLVQVLYVKLQIGVARYNAIYGSFATLPLFLSWIYIAWVVFLMGAEVAFAAQEYRRYVWYELPLTPIVKLSLALEIMEAAMADFRARRVSTRNSLASRLGQPEATIAPIVNDLVKGDKLRLITGRVEGYGPAAPEDEIRPAEFVDLIFGATVPEGRHCELAHLALDAARQALADKPIVCGHSELAPVEQEEKTEPASG